MRAPPLHSVMQQWDAGSAPRALMGNFVLPQLPVGQALAAARHGRTVLTRRSLLCEIRYYQEKIPARRSFVSPPCRFYYSAPAAFCKACPAKTQKRPGEAVPPGRSSLYVGLSRAGRCAEQPAARPDTRAGRCRAAAWAELLPAGGASSRPPDRAGWVQRPPRWPPQPGHPP